MTPRRTLNEPLTVQGLSLFTERAARLAIRPAEPGAGISFRRVDLEDRPAISAHVSARSDEPVHPVFAQLPPRCTSIASGSASIATIEHLMGALAGLGITDAEIETDGPELPILDGSARRFVQLIRTVGVRAHTDNPIEPLVVSERIAIERDGASITAEPRSDQNAPGAHYEYHLDYGTNPAIQPQSAAWDAASDDDDRFADQIAPARTFCLDSEAAQLRRAGLFTRFSPRELLVLSATGPIENELRFDNEPARHKLLDLIGDLALVGRPIRGRIVADKSGHALNHEMAARLLERFA